MRHRRTSAGTSAIGLLLVSSLLGLPAQAHKTEVSGDVAGVWHLEPNHSPKAGEPAQVWVALTQQGGRPIALEQCDCRLAIYDTGSADANPVLEPALEAFSPENFQSIPGAEVTFPDVGEYRIVLTGSPRGDATFAPFELSYTTIVAAGQTPTAPATPAEAAAPTNAPTDAQSDEIVSQDPTNPVAVARPSAIGPWVLGAIALSAVVAIALMLRLRQQRGGDP